MSICDILNAPDLPYHPTLSSEEFSGGTLHCNAGDLEELPAFTRVYGEVRAEEGSYIRFEIWLPRTFDGIFVATGNGGIAGGINHFSMVQHIRRGSAVVNTDMGTSRGIESGIENPAVWEDFGHRATHVATVIAKEIVSRVYHTDIRYSYFLGGSTGGQQALSQAQRYPQDYNGILAGAPANNRICLHTYFLWNYVHCRDEAGTPLFCEAECARIAELAVAFYHDREGKGEGENYVARPLCDRETVDAFIAYLRAGRFLTEQQLSALWQIYHGPVNPRTGERIYNGFPMGAEMGGCGLREMVTSEACPHDYPFFWGFGRDFRYEDFDFDHDLDHLTARLSPVMDANDPCLTPFFECGGKLIIVAGTGDAVVPSPDAVAYYRRVAETCPAAEAQSRFYLLPYIDHAAAGMHPHMISTDGTGRHLFEALRDWCEVGLTPGQMWLRLPEEISRQQSFPIMPFDPADPTPYPESTCERWLTVQ